jgi:alkylation response protein AidB-like acyl-CoA dehydrogenase
MEFQWTQEQGDLRASVRQFLERAAPVAYARRQLDEAARFDPEVWHQLTAELGLAALAVPEEHGGAGAGRVELSVVAEEMGRLLHGGPFLPTAVLAPAAILAAADPAAADEYLPAIAAGTLTVAVAVLEPSGHWTPDAVHTQTDGDRLTGTKSLVLDGADAELLLVLARAADGLQLFAVRPDAAGLTRTPLRVLDASRPMATLHLDGTPARPVGAPGTPVLEQVREAGLVFLAAEQAGGAARALEVTAGYARTRRQFGRLIGGFQGVKHRLADTAVRVELARSAAYFAAWQEPFSPAAADATAVAARYNSAAFLQVAKDMIQLHGGIGFTWEHDAHLYLRRARADQQILGRPEDLTPTLEHALLTEAQL